MNTAQMYNGQADRWVRTEPSVLSDFTARPTVFSLCDNVAGARVLDLGCGEGYCSRYLAKQGASHIKAIDISEKMIHCAQSHNINDDVIDYETNDVLQCDYGQNKYHLIISVFLFNYLSVNEMNDVMVKVYDALMPGGSFIFSVPHPLFPFVTKENETFFFQKEDKSYLSGRNYTFSGYMASKLNHNVKVSCVHKTIEDYFLALKAAGFTQLPELKECYVTDELLESDRSFFGPLENVPLHLVMKIGK